MTFLLFAGHNLWQPHMGVSGQFIFPAQFHASLVVALSDSGTPANVPIMLVFPHAFSFPQDLRQWFEKSYLPLLGSVKWEKSQLCLVNEKSLSPWLCVSDGQCTRVRSCQKITLITSTRINRNLSLCGFWQTHSTLALFLHISNQNESSTNFQWDHCCWLFNPGWSTAVISSGQDETLLEVESFVENSCNSLFIALVVFYLEIQPTANPCLSVRNGQETYWGCCWLIDSWQLRSIFPALCGCRMWLRQDDISGVVGQTTQPSAFKKASPPVHGTLSQWLSWWIHQHSVSQISGILCTDRVTLTSSTTIMKQTWQVWSVRHWRRLLLVTVYFFLDTQWQCCCWRQRVTLNVCQVSHL